MLDEQVRVKLLRLRHPENLPLGILRDQELIADRAPQADPLLGVLAALAGVPWGWRAVVQLVLQPAPRDWARRHFRRSLEHALEPERAERVRSSGPGGAAQFWRQHCWGRCRYCRGSGACISCTVGYQGVSWGLR